MTPAHARRLDALKYADSYTRMGALIALQRYPRFWSHMAAEWSGCDNIASHHGKITWLLHTHQEKHGFPIGDAMTAEACEAYVALPDECTVWRGCYSHNVHGMSWTLSRETAAKFPFLIRYRHERAVDRALLIEGRIRKADVAFVVMDRGEAEVVVLPRHVRIVAQSLAYDALEVDAQRGLFPEGRPPPRNETAALPGAAAEQHQRESTVYDRHNDRDRPSST